MRTRKKRTFKWALRPKLEIRFTLQDDCIGTLEDDRTTARLQNALLEAYRAKKLAVETHCISGVGKSSLVFEGDDPGAMYDLARPLLGELLPRRYFAVLHAGELRRDVRPWLGDAFDTEPYVQEPASVLVSVRLQDDDMGTQADDALIHPIVEDIVAAFEDLGGVWFDGDEYGGGWYVLFFYGDDDEAVFAAVEPFLARFGDREIVCERRGVRLGFKQVFTARPESAYA